MVNIRILPIGEGGIYQRIRRLFSCTGDGLVISVCSCIDAEGTTRLSNMRITIMVNGVASMAANNPVSTIVSISMFSPFVLLWFFLFSAPFKMLGGNKMKGAPRF